MIMRMVTMMKMLMLPSPSSRTKDMWLTRLGIMMGMMTMMVEMLMLAKMAFMRPTPSSLTKAMFLTRW